MKLDRKSAIRTAIMIFLLLAMYVASSGPALRYAVDHRTLPYSTFHLPRVLPPEVVRARAEQDWASEGFYQRVRIFYEPMLFAADAIDPRHVYWETWNFDTLRVSGGHIVAAGRFR